jgi:TetR/AcrR family transcriptional regulator, transcriptional repressor for nem operon
MMGGWCGQWLAGRLEEPVARYDKVHKQATRQRIIETAGHRFKQDGIDGSGVATLMADAGLTNGAFYAHFSSKDDLIAHVVADQLDTQAESFRALPPGRAGLEGFLLEYLSPQHRDNPADGCPSAALLDEIARCPAGTKHAYTDGAQAILEEIAARLAPEDPQSARAKALGLYTIAVGTLQVSRVVSDPKVADEVLEQGIQNARMFLG